MSLPVIRPLAESVINQIAAGEVVERPVSIAKELIENSLDAGATRIDIEVEEGGIRRLQVRDDGCGMPGEQLGLALQRHCTSKLVSADQLPRLISLGFRGEALAAIDAVTTLTLTSYVPGESHAWQLVGGVLGPAAHPGGTTVEVRDLFGRIPARRRFLRQPQTEWLHVQQLVRRIAFCTPLVNFTLWHDGQRALNLPAAVDEATAARRLRALFGAEFATAARPVERANDRLRVFGLVAGPTLARSQNDLQMISVNQRVIQDRHLSHAIRLAFEDKIPEGRKPCYALQIELSPEEVDVNVHPGKLEVRFQELREVHDLVFAAVRAALVENLPSASISAVVAQDYRVPPTRGRLFAGPAAVRETPVPSPPLSVTGSLWLLAGRYLVLQTDDVLELVDLRRLVAQVLCRRLEAEADPAAHRPLLFPVRIECADRAEAAAVTDGLKALGLVVQWLEGGTLALRALPRSAPEIDARALGLALARRGSQAPPAWLADALAASLQVPTTDLARKAWWQRWQGLVEEVGLSLAPYTRRLDASGLQALFDE